MASVVMTYGKKQRLLNSLGSKRRQKNLLNLMPVKKSERLAPSLNACHETSKQDHRTQTKTKISGAGIEEIASALLYDATPPSTRKQTPQSTHGIASSVNSAVSSLNQSGSDYANRHSDSPASLISGSSTSRGATRGNNLRYRASRVQKSPSNSPMGMATKTRIREASCASPSRKHPGLLRPISSSSQTQGVNHTGEGGAATPGSFPKRPVNSGPPTMHEWKQSHPVRMHAHGPDEIQQKVCTMLATTDALKPSPSQFKAAPASKMTRLVPYKVFAKVSSAWDRLHSKPSDEGLPNSKRCKQFLHDDTDGLMVPSSFCPTPASRSTSSINTLEIRLNEGDNLNRTKVQKIVGGRVNRRPVARDGKSLRGCRFAEDPFTESAQTPNRDNEGRKLGPKSAVKAASSAGPFDSERGFEEDLQDRILSTLPAASSTPRARGRGAQTRSSARRANLSGQDLEQDHASFGQVVIQLTEYESWGSLTPTRKNDKQVDGTERAPRAEPPRTDAVTARQDAGARRAAGMKKHPSPSKRALEDLQTAFRQYSELKKYGSDEALDELARQWRTNNSLSPRDKNALMGTGLGTRDRKARGLADSESELDCAAKLCVPRPAEGRWNRGRIRLAPAYRPMGTQADETDKLQ